MPIRNGEYQQRTVDQIFETLATQLLDEEPDANPRAESTYTYALLWALASSIAQNQEQSLEDVYNAAYVVDATEEELTKKARNLGVVRKDAVKATGVVEFSRDSRATQDYLIPSGTEVETVEEDPVTFETTGATTINGPDSETDGTLYSTSSTSLVTKTSFDVETLSRDSLDVSADYRTTNNSYTATIEIADATNGTVITTASTSNTTMQSVSDTYDVSSIEETITVEYRIKISNSSGTAELDQSSYSIEGQTLAKATIQALAGGADGNVGPNAITSMPSPPAGVDSVTNPNPTGDPSLTDTNGDPFRAGRDRESDSDLRSRVLDTDATDEGPSADGIELALEDIDGVVSKHVNTNPTSSTSNGLDPYSSEVVVYGGDVYDIGRTLYETMGAATLLRLQGGVNGTKETTSVYSQLFDTSLTIPITRPTLLTFDSLDVDIVHTNNYGGDVSVKDTVVEYIGGTRADDSTTVGELAIGDNVLVNEVENRIEDVNGVDFANVTLADVDGDGTDDTTTDSDGVPIVSVSDSEVARLDADNMTLSKTAR